MRSRDNVPVGFEFAARAGALVALAVLAWRLFATSGGDRVARVQGDMLDSALHRWTLAPPATAEIATAGLPDGPQRDWLVALRRTGTRVVWHAPDSSGSAAVMTALPAPASVPRLTVVSPTFGSVSISDDLGVIDSVPGGGVRTWRLSSVGSARVRAGASAPVAAVRDSFEVRPVLVVGTAGWEAKFVIAALEESGWPVSARLMVGPGAIVRQGSAQRVDTGSISAVVVLDSVSAIDAGELRRFVSAGGGLVAAGAGTMHGAVRGIRAAQVAGRIGGEIGGLRSDAPRTGLAARTFTAGAGAVILERRGGAPVIAAARVGSGRVVAVGYEDTWRLRMTPDAGEAPARHRQWWSDLVSSVAYARPVSRSGVDTDEAPFAAAVQALGAPGAGSLGGGSSIPWNGLLFVFAMLALLSEWASRRLRGLP
jgi:hypothetical protein